MNDHVFVISAYGESAYLEECIQSLLNQTKKTPVYIASSTPSAFLDELSKKYNLQCFYRDGKSDIKDDWNYACSVADSKWVTVAHQDDVYEPEYAEKIMESINSNSDAILAITDYRALIKGKKINNTNCKIRRFLRIPMKNKQLSKSKYWKKMILSLGNSICCPTVAYNKSLIDGEIFTSKMKFNIDWDTFYKFAQTEKRFIYIDKPLVCYRIHDEATTVKCMDNSLRIKEDTEMFEKFWPKWFVKIIMIFYKKAYEEYRK